MYRIKFRVSIMVLLNRFVQMLPIHFCWRAIMDRELPLCFVSILVVPQDAIERCIFLLGYMYSVHVFSLKLTIAFVLLYR